MNPSNLPLDLIGFEDFIFVKTAAFENRFLEKKVAFDFFTYIQKPDRILKFSEATCRLYYFDIVDPCEKSTAIIQTVNENKTDYSAYSLTSITEASHQMVMIRMVSLRLAPL